MRLIVRKLKVVLAISVAWLCAAAVAFAASLTATVDRNVVPVGESVTLSLTFEGAAPQGTPGLPNIPNFRVQGVSQSSSVTILNGQASQKFTYNYPLLALQPGDISIPAL